MREDSYVKLLDPIRLEKALTQQRDGPGPRNAFSGTNRPHWRLLMHRKAPLSMDAVFAVRWKNIALSGDILALMLILVAVLSTIPCEPVK